MKMRAIVVALVALTMIGCASQPQAPQETSGFLSGYQDFRPNPQQENSWIRTANGFTRETLTSYDKIALAPIEIWLNDQSKFEIQDKEKQQQLTQYFEQQIRTKIDSKYQFVPHGTPDSLSIQLALTNIEELDPEIMVRDFLPIAMARNAVQSTYRLAAAKKAVIGAASLEAKFVDTNTNNELIAVVVNSESDEMNVADEPENIESIKTIVEIWVDRLATALQPKDK